MIGPILPDQNTLPRSSAWRLLAHAPFIASGVAPLLLATIGVIVTFFGALALDRLIPIAGRPIDFSLHREATGVLIESLLNQAFQTGDFFETIVEPQFLLIRRFLDFFRVAAGARGALRSGIFGLWFLLVWGLFGTAISRTVLVRVSRGSFLGIFPSLRYSLMRLPTVLVTPLAPVLFALALAIPGALFGLLSRIPGDFGVLAPIAGFVPVFLGLITTILLVAPTLGWPLVATTMAAEDEDGFEIISRVSSYVKRRMVAYLILLLMTYLIGVGGLAAARLFTEAVFVFASWSVRLSGDRWHDLIDPWRSVASVLVLGWVYSYFWTAISLVYLRLRLEIDGAEMHEIADDRPNTSAVPVFIEELGPAS